jgi:hypothetical protein
MEKGQVCSWLFLVVGEKGLLTQTVILNDNTTENP